MYKIISASADIKWKDREKLKKWVTLDEGGEFSEEKCIETLVCTD